MKKVILLTISIICILFLSCKSKINESNKISDQIKRNIQQANFLEDIFSVKILLLNDVPNQRIGEVSGRIKLGKNGEFFFDDLEGGLFKYSKDGVFIKRLKKNGSGPGEYKSIEDFCLNDSNHVFIKNGSSKYVLEYDDNFNFLCSHKIDTFIPITNMIYKNNRFYLYSPAGMQKGLCYIYNEDWELIQRFYEGDEVGLKYARPFLGLSGCFILGDKIVLYQSTRLAFSIYDLNGKFDKEITPNRNFSIPETKVRPFDRNIKINLIEFAYSLTSKLILYEIMNPKSQETWDIIDLEGNIIKKNLKRKNNSGMFANLNNYKFAKLEQVEDRKKRILTQIIIYTLKNHEEK